MFPNLLAEAKQDSEILLPCRSVHLTKGLCLKRQEWLSASFQQSSIILSFVPNSSKLFSFLCGSINLYKNNLKDVM